MRNLSRLICLGGTLALTLSTMQAASAEGLVFSPNAGKPGASRAALFRSQTHLMDTKLERQYGATAPGAALDGSGLSGTLPSYNGRYKGKYLGTAKAAAARHNVPEDLFLRLVQQESGWNPTATSPKGAQGLAQLMPETAAFLGVDALNPEQNLEGGARYLRMMYDRFGDWKLALAAYNAGPLAVDKHGDIPPYEETQNYVLAVFGG